MAVKENFNRRIILFLNFVYSFVSSITKKVKNYLRASGPAGDTSLVVFHCWWAAVVRLTLPYTLESKPPLIYKN